MAAATDQVHPGHRWMLEALKFARNALDKQEVPSKSNEIIDEYNIRTCFSWLCDCT